MRHKNIFERKRWRRNLVFYTKNYPRNLSKTNRTNYKFQSAKTDHNLIRVHYRDCTDNFTRDHGRCKERKVDNCMKNFEERSKFLPVWCCLWECSRHLIGRNFSELCSDWSKGQNVNIHCTRATKSCAKSIVPSCNMDKLKNIPTKRKKNFKVQDNDIYVWTDAGKKNSKIYENWH